jgi:hypothetical protein
VVEGLERHLLHAAWLLLLHLEINFAAAHVQLVQVPVTFLEEGLFTVFFIHGNQVYLHHVV